jgi:hypothetical protein
MTQGGAVTVHLPGRSPRFGALRAPADSAGAPAPPQRRTVVPAGRSPQLAAQSGNRVNSGYGRPATNKNRRRRLHLLPSMMVSGVAATALSWQVSVFSGAAGV